MDANKIIEFLKSDGVTQEIWNEVADLIIEAIKNDENDIDALKAALEV